MDKKLKSILEKLGFTTEIIQAFESADADQIKKLSIDDVVEDLMEGFKTTLKNDPAFMTEVNSKVRSEVLNSKERKIMKLAGVSKEEYDALPQSTKFDSLIELAVSKLKQKDGNGDDSDSAKEIAKLNKVIEEKDEEIRKFNEEILPAKEKEWISKIEGKDISRFLEKEVLKHKVIGDPEFILMAAENKLRQKFDLKIKNDNIVLLKKGTDFEEHVNNKPLKFGEAVKQVLEEAKVIQLSNAGAPKGGKAKVETTDDDDENGKSQKTNLPGFDKAQQRIEANGKVDKSKLFGGSEE